MKGVEQGGLDYRKTFVWFVIVSHFSNIPGLGSHCLWMGILGKRDLHPSWRSFREPCMICVKLKAIEITWKFLGSWG